jgi:sugar lactone lactonase YvrE
VSGAVEGGQAGAPELVLDARAVLGEGPVWDARRSVLWWVDVLAGVVHAFDPADDSDRGIVVGSAVGCVVPMADGRLLVAAADGLLALSPETGETASMARFDPSPLRLRCNDGKCDPEGRLWVGRMAYDLARGAGSLLRLEPDGRFATVLTDLTIPNGLAWPADGRSMVHIDSTLREITRYDFDRASGALGPGRRLLSLDDLDLPGGAVPDGMTIDEEDCLWVAVWGGACIIRVALDGRVVRRIELPVSQPSSCAFGGADLGDLYITSARDGLAPARLAQEPVAGGLFRVRPGVRGRPADTYRG